MKAGIDGNKLLQRILTASRGSELGQQMIILLCMYPFDPVFFLKKKKYRKMSNLLLKKRLKSHTIIWN